MRSTVHINFMIYFRIKIRCFILQTAFQFFTSWTATYWLSVTAYYLFHCSFALFLSSTSFVFVLFQFPFKFLWQVYLFFASWFPWQWYLINKTFSSSLFSLLHWCISLHNVLSISTFIDKCTKRFPSLFMHLLLMHFVD